MSPELQTGAVVAPRRQQGAFVAIVGPSGAGKDTLMSRAARDPALDPRILFARRVVTRAALVASEDHDSLDEAGFARAEAEGAFSLLWSAHGLRYGLPRSILDDVSRGRTVVANLSRRSLGEAVRVFGSLHVIEVTARPEILLERLVARGREVEATIRERLDRQVSAELPSATSRLEIDNSGDLQAATERVVRHLNALCGSS